MNRFYYQFSALTFVILLLLPCLSNISTEAMSYQRYVLEDRKLKSICILPFKAKDSVLGMNISEKFVQTLKNNSSGIEVIYSENPQDCESVLSGELKDYISETKTNTISDSFSYDILEQQIKVAIEIEVLESKTKDTLWRRRASRYKSQSWLDFTRMRLADNNILSFFSVPNQLATSIKKQYNEKEFIEKAINDVVIDLSTNLVKLK